MEGERAGPLAQAQAALEARDWAAAKSGFEAALAQEERPEALLGLGTALYWLEDIDASLRARERAYAAFRRANDPLHAAMAALQLAEHYGGHLGNLSVAAGWLARASRLVDENELAPLEGWVLIGRAALSTLGGDPVAGERHARAARELARRARDADLELCALTQLGGALVLAGRQREGIALLDEAMAAALAGEGGPETVVQASCVTIACCSVASDLKRAVQWIRAAEDFNRRYGSSHLYATCRTHYGTVLFALGRWEDAERELEAALRLSRAAEPALHAEALGGLAELRLAQGSTDEAARLVDGLDAGPVLGIRASVCLARAEPVDAASLVLRRLREVPGNGIESARLLELLSECAIAREDAAGALAASRRLEALASSLSCDVVEARSERALGRALTAVGSQREATPHLERALTAFGRLEMPYEAARARALLARAAAASDRERAIVEARGALEAFEALGAARDADATAASLRALGVRAARRAVRGAGLLTRREREVLALLGEGLSNRELAERLVITRKTAENHVASVLAKLELRSRAQATAYALRRREH